MELVGAMLILVSSGIIIWSVISWDLEQMKKERKDQVTQELQDERMEHCDPNESWSDSYRRDV